MKIRNLVCFPALLVLVFSCSKENYDPNKYAHQTILDIKLVGPVLKGSFLLSDLIENQDNKTEFLVIDGDTVKFHIIRDSVLVYNTHDISVIPQQFFSSYNIFPKSDLDVTALPNDFIINELIKDTIYTLHLENSMRLDSLYLNSGNLNIQAENHFQYRMDLYVSSPSIFDRNNVPLNHPVPINANGTADENIDLSGYKIVFDHLANSASTIALKFTPVFHKNPGQTDMLLQTESINLNVNTSNLNDFDILFGFLGYYTSQFDTIVDFKEGKDGFLNKLDGTFQATNPKLKINYVQKFGVSTSADFNFDVYHGPIADVQVDLLPKIIPPVEYFTDPPLEGTLIYTKDDQIDNLISFPIADSLKITGTLETNKNLDSLTTFNFVKNNSVIIIGLDIEVPLEFRADLTYTDTIKPDFGKVEDIDFEYLNLHYWFANGFPLGFNPMLYLYDSTISTVIDSIDLNLVTGDPFLKPAKVDANGLVIQNQIEEIHGYTSLDQETSDNLLKPTTKIIIKAVLQTYLTNSVKILPTSKLNYQFGIEAKGTYKKTSN